MASSVKKILILNRNLRASVEMKRSLESTGRYEVAAFTTPDAALDHLRHQPDQSAVIVDFNLPRVNGRDVVLRVRAIAPDALIIASPDTPEVARIVGELKLAGAVDLPSPARKLITVINRIIEKGGDIVPETTESPARGGDSETARIKPPEPPKKPSRPRRQSASAAPESPGQPAFSSLDDVLVRIGGFEGDLGTETLDVAMDDADYADDNTVEFVLTGEYAALKEEFDRNPQHGPYKADSDDAVDIFQRLAAEEPPPPTFEEGGTVGDLMIGVGDTNLQAVVNILRESRPSRRTSQEFTVSPSDASDEAVESQQTDTAPPPPVNLPEADSISPADSTPPVDDDLPLVDSAARHILENALDDTTPLTFSLDDFKMRVKSRGADTPDVKPLPSWEQEIDRYIREPAFLEPKLTPELHPDDPSEQPTDLFAVEGDDPAEAETNNLPAQSTPPAPPPGLPEAQPAAEPEPEPEKAVDPTVEAGAVPPEIESTAESESEPVARPTTLPEAVEDPDEATLPPIQRMVEKQQAADPEVARMALALTHGSLEATAALTLLARDGKIAGYGGEMPVAEIELLRRAINDDWESTPEDARIRFVRIEQSGTDYVLYTRGSEGGYSLSLVFAGNLAMGNMRRQFEKLVAALQDVPALPLDSGDEVDAEIVDLEEELGRTQAEAAALTGKSSVEAGSKPVTGLIHYTLVWLVNDPELTLTPDVAKAVVAGLDFQLAREGWDMESVRVYEDYVYVQAGIPEELALHDVVEDLKRRSGQIARGSDPRLDPATLWLDSYLAMMPARELDIHDIQRFIHFARAR